MSSPTSLGQPAPGSVPGLTLEDAAAYDLGDVNTLAVPSEIPSSSSRAGVASTPEGDLPSPPESPAPVAAPSSEEVPPRRVPPQDPATGRFVRSFEHNPHVTQLALEQGMSEAEVRRTDPDQLAERLYWTIHQQQLAAQADRREQRLTSVADRLPTEPEPEPAIDWGVTSEGEPVRESDLLPGLVKVFKDQQRQIQELQRQLEGDRRERQARDHFTRLDRAFSQHATLLGDGPGAEMDRQSPEFQRRLAVIGVLGQLKLPGTLEQQVQRVVTSLFPTAVPSAPSSVARGPSAALAEETAALAREWQEAGLARPTGRNPGEPPKGPRAAEAHVARMLRDHPALFGSFEQDFNGHFLEDPPPPS